MKLNLIKQNIILISPLFLAICIGSIVTLVVPRLRQSRTCVEKTTPSSTVYEQAKYYLESKKKPYDENSLQSYMFNFADEFYHVKFSYVSGGEKFIAYGYLDKQNKLLEVEKIVTHTSSDTWSRKEPNKEVIL